MWNRLGVCVCLLLACLVEQPAAGAQRRPKTGRVRQQNEAGGVSDYRSRNFLIHTDLPAKEARDLLSRMERMFKLISRYWGRRNPRQVECFVVKDLKNWSPAWQRRMHPNGLARIRSGGGVTITSTVRRGRLKTGYAKVYAVATGGTPLHEAVHAFCGQAFGETGPVWYAEGMAEMGQYWRDDNSAVNCETHVIKYLTSTKPRALSEIVDRNQKTGDSWQNYAWRWGLCHLLANNPNYAPRFRPLGLGMLTGGRATFARVYGNMAREIEFEYRFFLKHLERGYRVDLCSWNWKARYKSPLGATTLTAKIDARRGWQPAGLLLKSGRTYQFSAEGGWALAKKGKTIAADGDASGNGKLIGVIFRDYQLSKPFELGAYGKFTAPSDGQLLLRCKEDWSKLADNKGTVTVRLKVDGKGNPLPRPETDRAK